MKIFKNLDFFIRLILVFSMFPSSSPGFILEPTDKSTVSTIYN